MTYKGLEERYESFGSEESDKQLFMEYLSILNYMPEEDFSNLFHMESITDAEFYSILDFCYHQDCYLVLYKLLKDNRERLVKPSIEEIKGMALREDLEERMKSFGLVMSEVRLTLDDI